MKPLSRRPPAQSAIPNSDEEAARVEERLSQALDEIYAAVDAGKQVDREQLLAKYADVANQLAECFQSLDFIQNVAPQLADARDNPEDESIHERATVGEFRIVREIGRGGMGVVYEARQETLDRRVALKILPFAALVDERQLKRFKNEARAAATLHHPNIVPIHSVGSDKGVHYYAMQLIDGPSLAVVLHDLREAESPANAGQENDPQSGAEATKPKQARDAVKPLAADTRREVQAALSTMRRTTHDKYFRTIAQWGVEAAEALAYAHASGVLHRDIKPGNLLIDRAGKLWVTDFGVARLDSDASVTMTGEILGTLRYMAPEQALAKHGVIDQRTDIYSLGVTLYELATTQLAFSGNDRPTLLQEIADKELVAPRRLTPAIPVDLETIILKAMAKEPSERYLTAAELANDLKQFLAVKPITAKPPTLLDRARKWSRRHRATTWSASIVLLLIGIASLTGLVWSHHKNRQLSRAVHHAEEATQRADDRAAQLSRALTREADALAKVEAANATTEEALAATQRAVAHAQKNLYFATMRQAFADLQQGESARFAESMVGFIPLNGGTDLRNWEWYYLLTLYQQQERVLLEHVNGVRDLAWHPQGKYLTTAGVAGSVGLWDTNDWSLKSVLRWNGAEAIDWHPDGNLLAIAYNDNVIRIWDTKTGLFAHELPTGQSRCRQLEFSPDGSRLGAAIREQGCKVWDSKSFVELWSHDMDAQGVSWSPDGRQLACSGKEHHVEASDKDHAVIVFEAASGKVDGKIGGLIGVTPVRWSPRGDRIATGSLHELIQIFDANSFDLLHSIAVESLMSQFRWSHDGQYLAAGIGKNVEIFDDQLNRLDTLKGHIGSSLSVAWALDNRSIVAGGTDGTILIWPVQRPPNLFGIRTICAELATSDEADSFFSRTGRFVATLDPTNSEIVIRRVADSTIVKRFSIEVQGVRRSARRSAAWSANDAHLAYIADRNRAVTRLNIANGQRESLVTLEQGEIRGIDWNPVYSQLAVSVEDADGSSGRVDIWNTDVNELIDSIPLDDAPVRAVAWDPSGVRLAIVEGNTPNHALLRIWDVRSKTLRQTLTGHFRFHGKPVWSPDGQRIVAFGWDGGITIWDAQCGELENRLYGHANPVQGIWHASGQRLVTCSDDKTVRLWDIASGEEILRVDADCDSLVIPPNASDLYLAGHTLDVIEVRDERDATPLKLLGYAAAVKVNRRELEEAHDLLRSIPVGSAQRNYLLRRLLNQHYWLATGVHAAINHSSAVHLTKMLTLWQEIVDGRETKNYEEYGRTQDGYSTVVLLQGADIAAVRAAQYQDDPNALLAVLEDVIRAVEQQLPELSLTVDEKENIPKMMNAVRGGRRRLATQRWANKPTTDDG